MRVSPVGSTVAVTITIAIAVVMAVTIAISVAVGTIPRFPTEPISLRNRCQHRNIQL